MQGTQIASAFVAITGDNSFLKKTLKDTQSLIKGFVNNLVQGIGQGIGQALFNQINRGIQLGMNLVKSGLKATSDLNEALSKTVVAFGQSAKGILEWSKTSDTALGQSRFQALEAAATFGLLFSSMGLAEDASAKMSIALVELATDMASINNIGIDEALVKIRAGLVGETEPLRTVGVLLNAVAVEQEALNSGLAETTEAITEQDKVMARYNLILRQTTKTQGDFQRTSEGIANQERILAAQRENALAQIGAAFAPLYLVILRNLNRIIGEISPYGENIVRSLAEGIVNGVIYILPALKFVKDVITYWLKPGSPPNLLPDLDKWGKAAMQVYLDAWSAADFGVLQTLGQTIENIVRSFVTSGDIAENDIVSRVFGTREAIATAVAQWRNAGHVTEQALRDIESAAGPAGFSLAGLVRAYFDLEGASRRAAQAQRELSDATEEYDRRLQPLNDQLDEINDKEQAIRDRQDASAARKTLRDPRSTINEKRLAQLELERIKVRQGIEVIEEERDLALRAAQEKLKAAQREEEVARNIYAAQQALLEQTMINNRLIGEQNELRKQEQEATERVYQAALQYNLALADTEGKIALLRLELGRHAEGSVEYYNILTQIAGLEKQLKDERGEESLIPENSVLPSLDELGVPQWATELSERLDKAMKEAFGIKPLIDPDVFLAQGFDTNTDGTAQVQAPIAEEASEQVQDFVQTLKDLTTAINSAVPTFKDLATGFEAFVLLLTGDGRKAWGLYADAVEEDVKRAEEAGDDHTADQGKMLSGYIALIGSLFSKDWGQAWQDYLRIQNEAADQSVNDMRERLQWFMDLFPTSNGEPTDSSSPLTGLRAAGVAILDRLSLGLISGLVNFQIGWIGIMQWIRDQLPGSEPADVTSPLYGLSDAGEAILDMVWSGLKTKWLEVSTWWTEKMQWLRDMLPFSEPRNPDSPLAGLKESGKAILNQIQLGMDTVDLRLPLPNSGLMAAGVPSTSPGRSLVIEKGAIEITGINGAESIVPSMEEAFKRFLEELI